MLVSSSTGNAPLDILIVVVTFAAIGLFIYGLYLAVVFCWRLLRLILSILGIGANYVWAGQSPNRIHMKPDLDWNYAVMGFALENGELVPAKFRFCDTYEEADRQMLEWDSAGLGTTVWTPEDYKDWLKGHRQ